MTDSPLVGLTWQNEAGNFINLIISQGPEGAFQVGERSIEEAQINGETAALVCGVWDGQGQWINTERQISLMWKHDEVLYTLVSVGDPPLTVQDLIRVAESLQPLTQ